MGNQPPPKNYNPKLEKQRLEIACMKVKGHLEIQRDRRMGQANGKEQQLIKMIGSPTRSKDEEKHKAASLVTDICFIDACNIVIRFCDILKDRSMIICESKGNPEAIKEMLPFIESVIWSSKHLNLQCMQEFSGLMIAFFGSQPGSTFCCDETKVDPELKRCLLNIMPSDTDINEYFFKLVQKTGIQLSVLNSVGHEVYAPGSVPQAVFAPQFAPQNPLQQQQQMQSQQFNPNNVNINIRVQEFPQQQQGQFNPNPINFSNPTNQQNNFNPINNFVPQIPQQQQPFQPQQQQQQQPAPNQFNQGFGQPSNFNPFQAPQNQQQYPNNGYPNIGAPSYPNLPPVQQQFNNIPSVQIPTFNIPSKQPQQQPAQGFQQQQQQQPAFQPQVQVPTNNNEQSVDSLEERLRRLREGL